MHSLSDEQLQRKGESSHVQNHGDCVWLVFVFHGAYAQRFNAFVGYSHIGFGPNLYSLQLDPLSPPLRRSKNGWNASLEAKVPEAE
jgi:hypothetical protein